MRGLSTLKRSFALIGMACLLPATVAAQGDAAAEAAEAEEIVVTARRTGIPVWRVTGPTTTIVLIGSIDGVAKDTRWDPGALTATLVKADRVMFPGMSSVSLSPFALLGYAVKWRNHGTLPKGQSLADFMPPQQFQRLVALKNRGVLKAGFERRHPFHLAMQLRNVAKGKRGFGIDADTYVSKAVRKHKLKMVPLRELKAKPLLNDFFTSPPGAFVPCLLDSVALLESGPATVKARSDAWAERRVPDVIASPADKVYESCSPAAIGIVPRRNLRPEIRALMAQPQLTVAVVNLRVLAEGGILDDLAAAGFRVQGPRWKR